jgi:hypothetical protein
VLIHCFAGCEALDVVHSVGLTLADLFFNHDNWSPVPYSKRIGKNYKSTLEAIEIPLTVILLGLNLSIEGKLTIANNCEVTEAYNTIARALCSAGIRPPVLQEVDRRLRHGK